MASMIIKNFLFAGVILLITACTTVSERAEQWPSHWPSVGVFEAAYQADKGNRQLQSEEDYIKWVRRFYQGWSFHSDGWDWLTEEVLSGIEDYQQQRLIKHAMYSIGLRISAEWAKTADYRVINTQHLWVWIEALKVSSARDEEAWLVAKVSVDIDALLARELKPSAIKTGRYYLGVSGDEDDEFSL